MESKKLRKADVKQIWDINPPGFHESDVAKVNEKNPQSQRAKGRLGRQNTDQVYLEDVQSISCHTVMLLLLGFFLLFSALRYIL